MKYAFQSKRRRERQLDFRSNSASIKRKSNCGENYADIYSNDSICVLNKDLDFLKMHKNTRIGLVGFAVVLLAVAVILLLNLNSLVPNPTPPGSCVVLDGGQTCYAKDPNPYRNYGTKTAYHVVLGNNNNDIDVKNCTPKVFYMLSRHATRYPDKEYIEYINKYLPDLKKKIMDSYNNKKANLCEEDIKKFQDWNSAMQTKDENKLSYTGSLESEELGKRLRKRFGDILNVPYSPETFVIEYTSRVRTKDTAENFARGLFDESDFKKINFNGTTNDKVLQFHKECKKIKKKCGDQNYDIKEVDKFANSSLMQNVVSSVSKRIGFNVSYDDVKHMHVACVFGFALNISDAWCAVFSTDDIKVLEFQDDIDDYYKDSYGNEVNFKQACPVVQYIVNLFKSYSSEKKNKVVLQFSHAGGIKKVYAALGLFRDDDPLTASNFCALNNRKWRTSNIAPFNTNIVFVLYNCDDQLKFITLHNEKPVLIAGCDSQLCPLQKFYDQYQSDAENCNLKEICDTCKIE